MQEFRNKDLLTELRSSTKWLIASSGATAAVLVAGVQFSSLGKLSDGPAIFAATGLGIAILSALWLLYRASKILTIPRPSASRLAHKEINDPRLLEEPREELPEDPHLKWVYERRDWLLDGAPSINKIYSDMVAARQAIGTLQQGKPSQWNERRLEPESTHDKREIQAIYNSTRARLEEMEDALHYQLSYKEFSTLMRYFPWFGFAFAAAVVGFAIAPIFN